MRRTVRTILTLVVGGVITATIYTCSGPVESMLNHGEKEANSTAVKRAPVLPMPQPAFAEAAGQATLADVAGKTVGSVVNISTEKVIKNHPGMPGPFFNDPFFRHFFQTPRIPQEQREKSLGSGVIVSKDGIILTNNHVVEDADEVKVTLADGRDFEAEVVGTDPESDIGVVRLKGDDIGDLTPIPIGDSSTARLGQVVLAIGDPFGVGKTVTMGIISATGRANVGIVDYEDFIQTDAAINPGNSGGALVNMRGELIGINTAILSRSGGYQGIGFAIPSNMAKSIMDSLITNGKVVRGWLGVGIQDLDSDLAEGLDLSGKRGVLVAQVEKDSPAQKAGIERGDVILSVDGTVTDSAAKLRNLVATSGADKKVKIDLMRDGDEKTITVQLGTRPGDVGPAKLDADHGGALGGLTLAPLTDDLRSKLNLPDDLDHGVVVTEIEPGSRGAMAGFRVGDVILEVNRKKISTVSELENAYKDSKGTVAVLVQRGERTLFVALRKE